MNLNTKSIKSWSEFINRYKTFVLLCVLSRWEIVFPFFFVYLLEMDFEAHKYYNVRMLKLLFSNNIEIPLTFS